jgi:hypothetical protein
MREVVSGIRFESLAVASHPLQPLSGLKVRSFLRWNGANGTSDIEGKAATVAARKCG